MPLGYPLSFLLGYQGKDPLTYAKRLIDNFPKGWVSDDARQVQTPSSTRGLFASLMLAFGYQLSYVDTYSGQEFVVNDRLATADTTGLDAWAADFFGSILVRNSGESDASFRARVQAQIAVIMNNGGVTREAIRQAVKRLTGLEPRITEFWRPSDVGSIAQQIQCANVGAAGTTQYIYLVAPKLESTNSFWGPMMIGLTATGNTTLNGSNYNQLTWPAFAPGAVGYNVWRIKGGPTQGFLAAVAFGTNTYNDQGTVATATPATPTNCFSFTSTDQKTAPFRWGGMPGAAAQAVAPTTGGTQYLYYIVADANLSGTGLPLQIMAAFCRNGPTAFPSSGSPVNLSWTAVAGAAQYRVFRMFVSNVLQSLGPNGLIATVTTTTATDTGASASVGYPYTIAAANSGLGYQGAIDAALPTTPPLTNQNVYDALNNTRAEGITTWCRILTQTQLAQVTS